MLLLEKGSTITLKSRQSQRLNLLGLLNRRNELYPYIFEGKITSQIVIAYLDEFSHKLTKKTVIVMDNASIHRSAALVDKCAAWQKKNLEIFWLPTYSLQLNLIEIRGAVYEVSMVRCKCSLSIGQAWLMLSNKY